MSVIGHKFRLPNGTQIVLFKLVKFEQGWVFAGQVLFTYVGLVAFTKATPFALPQIRAPLN